MSQQPCDLGLVKAGVITTVARWPSSAEAFGPEPDGEVVEFAPGAACAGMLWDGQSLSAPPPPEPEPPGVPIKVSMRQARLALLAAGLLSTVQTYMDGASEATRIEWDYATDVWRSRDLVAGVGSTLGLTSDQIDALFIAAAAIP